MADSASFTKRSAEFSQFFFAHNAYSSAIRAQWDVFAKHGFGNTVDFQNWQIRIYVSAKSDYGNVCQNRLPDTGGIMGVAGRSVQNTKSNPRSGAEIFSPFCASWHSGLISMEPVICQNAIEAACISRLPAPVFLLEISYLLPRLWLSQPFFHMRAGWLFTIAFRMRF